MKIDSRNARAHADYEASGKRQHHNMSAELLRLQDEAAAALAAIDEQLHREFPVGCIVTVEDLFHPARYIKGPVVGHYKSTSLSNPGLRVKNERTGTVRNVGMGSFIYREA